MEQRPINFDNPEADRPGHSAPDEFPPLASTAVKEGTKALAAAGPDALIDRLFDAPFQIDAIREQRRFDLINRERAEAETLRQWLTFFLGREEYAISIDIVNEIIKPREITDIPGVPGFVLGIISLRGIIVPVYDLACRLGLGRVDEQQPNRIIICQSEDRPVGLLVDQIRQVVRLSEAGIESTAALLSGPEREFIAGVGRFQGRMLILLQLRNILRPGPAW